MALTRKNRTLLSRTLFGVLWLGTAFLVLFNLLTGRYITQWPSLWNGLPAYQDHVYTTLTGMPLVTITVHVFSGEISRVQPHFGILFAAIILVAVGIGCVILAKCWSRWRLVGRCDECGYDLQGIESSQCPECGASVFVDTSEVE